MRRNGVKYAIIGKSGEGKSTLAKLLLHLISPDRGECYLGEKSYQQLSKADVACAITYLGQEPYLFPDTLQNNITLQRSGSYERAKQNSNVGSIFSLQKEGEETMAAEAGNNFSGGEKQRISIARALFTKKPILILDEFSSALDDTNAKEIEQNLLNLPDQTVIVITHRLKVNDFSWYDFVYELKNGEIFVRNA